VKVRSQPRVGIVTQGWLIKLDNMNKIPLYNSASKFENSDNEDNTTVATWDWNAYKIYVPNSIWGGVSA